MEPRGPSAALARHVPGDLVEIVDEAYDIASPDGRLDVFRPRRDEPLPTVVWVHGGAFVSGSKSDVANYLRVLAGRGLTTVGVDYSIAPGSRYPTPVKQVAAALAHLVDHADRLGIDPGRVVLAGDSAGAQIAAQVALLVTDPAYAAEVGIDVAVPPSSLRGLVLFCGAYDFRLARGSTRLGSWLVDTAIWSYLGSSRRHDERTTRQGTVPLHVSPSFPPTFVSAGNGDPLLPHTLGLVEALEQHERRRTTSCSSTTTTRRASGTSTSSTSTASTAARRWTALSPSCTASPAEATGWPNVASRRSRGGRTWPLDGREAAERGLSTVARRPNVAFRRVRSGWVT